MSSLSYPELGCPEILCCFACTWTSTSSINKIQRNYEGLKIPACLCPWGKLWTTGYKKTKSATATFEELGAKAGYYACPLHMMPPKGCANHLSHPSRLPSGLAPESEVLVAQSCPALCDPMDCKAPRLLCLSNSSGKYTGVSSHSLLQGIFLTQGSNLGLLHCRQILYRVSHQGSPGLAPTLTPYKEPVCPSSASEHGSLLLVSCSHPCYRSGPNKTLRQFLIWPLINLY